MFFHDFVAVVYLIHRREAILDLLNFIMQWAFFCGELPISCKNVRNMNIRLLLLPFLKIYLEFFINGCFYHVFSEHPYAYISWPILGISLKFLSSHHTCQMKTTFSSHGFSVFFINIVYNVSYTYWYLCSFNCISRYVEGRFRYMIYQSIAGGCMRVTI